MGRPRRDEMSSEERMRALLSGQQPDRVPFDPFARGFCARNVGYSVASFYNDPEKSFQAQLWTREQYGYDGNPAFGYASYGAWEFGGEVKFPSSQWSQAPSITRYAVESEEDVDKLELPDVKTAGSLPLKMEFSKLEEKHGLTITTSCGNPFVWAANICSLDRLCRWMIKKPELARRVLRLATDHGVDVAHYWAQTFGPEHIIVRDSLPTAANQVISPKHFEQFVLPYQIELHEKILALGIKHFFIHICGEQNENLPYLAQVPMGEPGICSFGHEVDITTAIKYFGDSCIIAGNVEPQVIQNGTPQQVYELCKQAIEKGKQAPRGYILMSGCELPVMAPPYNLYVMTKAVTDFGWYD